MKKRLFLSLLAIVLLATSFLAGCAPKAAPATEVPVVVPVTTEVSTVEVAPTTSAPPLVFAAFASVIEEPWDGVIHAALLAAQAEGRITYKYTENIGYSGDMERVLADVVEKQHPIAVFGDAFGNEEAVRRVAALYPDTPFIFGSGFGPSAPNLSVFDNWIHEPAYLAGMLAGGLTKKNTVGVIGGFPVPEVNRLVNAFIAGARETNPKVTVLVNFINSWFDPATAAEQTRAQIDAGADVFYAERFGVIEVAAAAGDYVFGNMSDQNSLAPEFVVSSVSWTLEPTVKYVLDQIAAGSYIAQDLKDFSMFANGGSFLAPYHGLESKLPAALLDAVAAKEDLIKSGLFRVDINEGQPAAVNKP
jgi:basic membrane protein A and related proteins